jgi:hypothetical protein
MIVFIKVACGAGMSFEPNWYVFPSRITVPGHRPACERRADELAELLARWRRADQEAGLEILRDVTGLRGRDRDDRADGENGRSRRRILPTAGREHRRGAEQGHERDSRSRLRRHAHDADDARRDGDEQDAEDADAGGAHRRAGQSMPPRRCRERAPRWR